jgi:hypothetical protein
LTLTANLNNPFHKEVGWKSTLRDTNFRTVNWNYRPGRQANLSIRWTFGKLTENVSRKRGISNDDLKSSSN